MKITERAAFKRARKRLHVNQKRDVEQAIKSIYANVQVGEPKKGDLTGTYVYKFSCVNQQYLLAYTYTNEELILEFLGSHENFYRDFKRFN